MNPSPYDLHFTLFRIPVRVQPSFWLMTAILGWSGSGGAPAAVVIFVWCAFLSILVHELGHALTSEAFGVPANIVLLFTGGLTFSRRHDNSTWKQIIQIAMGPGAQFLLFGLLFAVRPLMSHVENPYLILAYRDLYWINLFWPLLNLLPIYPLDGGQLMFQFCELFRLRSTESIVRGVSIITAVAMTAFFMVNENTWGMLMMASLVLQNLTQNDRFS